MNASVAIRLAGQTVSQYMCVNIEAIHPESDFHTLLVEE
ncbi:hypothetical protein KL86PLE_130150 [uncultured Pleomorphomonas sp.]|uniref:Uncharacterized protein n=1 Tax=uncultured Pleomorphomonas sp. TaxID=442121 RepID=A0A212L9K8_9HYPH|nr:hypothetical protein KL86PLE_130150 [uncultured Pleomorphomonas sp.]